MTQDPLRNFPPPDITESPLTILQKQARALTDKTRRLLQCRIETNSSTRNDNLPWYSHSFFIQAPLLNYEYRLLRVGHGVDSFEDTLIECPAYRDVGMHTRGQEEFIRRLDEILTDPKVRRVLDSVYSQASAASQEAS